MDRHSILDQLAEFSRSFDPRLNELLTRQQDVPPQLREAMVYAALGGGKRLRPFLVAECCTLAGGSFELAFPAGAAIECIHSFSLVHDDLPAMDDDDLRRGRPTTHKKFGEAVAILAGDALLTLAFEIIGSATQYTARAPAMVVELARATGWTGMIGGQTADILGQRQAPDRELAEAIQLRKTARLFECACRLGALAADADDADITRLADFGRLFGRAFQVADDMLDITASPDQLGKATGKDSAANKQTLPQCVGLEQSRIIAEALVRDARGLLEPFGSRADTLRYLVGYVVERDF